jgi:hypothetical protein
MFFYFQFYDVVEPWNAFIVIILGILHKNFEKKIRKIKFRAIFFNEKNSWL